MKGLAHQRAISSFINYNHKMLLEDPFELLNQIEYRWSIQPANQCINVRVRYSRGGREW